MFLISFAKMYHPFSSASLNCPPLSGLTFFYRFIAYLVASLLNMHKILVTGRGVTKKQTLYFTSYYYSRIKRSISLYLEYFKMLLLIYYIQRKEVVGAKITTDLI